MSTVGIIGAGLIGRSWAVVFSRGGWDVRLTDTDPKALAEAPRLLRQSLGDCARHDLVDDPRACLRRISTVPTLEEAVAEVDFVQECGPETVSEKARIFKALDVAAPAAAILASSSSAIVSSRYAEKLAGRARCLVAHPVNPPHLVPLVELCPAPWTSKETVAAARCIYEQLGQVPITVLQEAEGFILNRLQGAMLAEAFRLVGEGYCSAEDLDKTVREGLGLRWSFMGPLETIELNAPGGIADYCARYGPFYKRVASEPPSPNVFSKRATDKIAHAWGPVLEPEVQAAKMRWRDDRLAALAAHKKRAKAFRK